jgi:hypothetical protein
MSDTITILGPKIKIQALRYNDPYWSDLLPTELIEDEKTFQLSAQISSIVNDEYKAYLKFRKLLTQPFAILLHIKGEDERSRTGMLRESDLLSYTIITAERASSEEAMNEARQYLASVNLVISGYSKSIVVGEYKLWGEVYIEQVPYGDPAQPLRGIFVSDRRSFTVHLHEIYRISRILNMPRNWEYFVPVSYDTPTQIDRIRHTMRIGEIALELPWNLPTFERPQSDNPVILGILRQMLARPYVIVQYRERVLTTPISILLARLWSGILVMGDMRNRQKKYQPTGIPLDCTGILWDDFIPGTELVQKEAESVLMPIDIPIMRAVVLLTGRDRLTENDVILQHYEVGRGPGFEKRLIKTSAGEVLSSMLRAYPDDVSPLELGLDLIVRREIPIEEIPTRLYRYLKVPASTILIAMAWTRDRIYNVREDEFEEIGEMFERILGKYVLSRMLLSLLHFLARDRNERAEHFARVLEDIISV